jgi:PAS domain S-box-containing protein
MIENADNGKKLAALLRASPLAIIELDRVGIVTLWNPAAEYVYGWSAAEAVGRHYCDLVVPEDEHAEFEATHAQALAGAVTERVATRRRKDGRLIEVNASIAALRNDQDEPTSVLVIFSDVTERQRAERALKQAHADLQLNAEHLETLIDNIYDMILIISNVGRILYASTSIERVAGYEAVSAENADVFEYVHPDDLEKIRKVLHFLLENPGDVARTSGRFRHRNGHWIDMAITAHFAPSLGGVVVNARDETWRAQADAALKASERKFRGIVEHIQDGVTLIGETGVVIEWSRAMEAITGLARDDALGRLIWDIQYDLTPVERKAPDTLEVLRDLARRILLTGHIPLPVGQFEETIVQRPDGERRFVEASLAPIATDRGFMLASILRDGTERKRLQEEMERQVARRSAELPH